MSELKEVSQEIESISIGINSKNQIVNIMMSGRGISKKGITTRHISVDLRNFMSKDVFEGLGLGIKRA